MNKLKSQMNMDGHKHQKTLTGILLAIVLGLVSSNAEQLKPFPKHWGEPPPIQTRDFVEWPDGYGHGSGTVAKWIEANMAKDSATNNSPSTVLYAADFGAVDVGNLPDGFLVLNGEFSVQEVDGKKLMQLPGTPIESFAVMFGPATNQNTAVSTKVLGTSKGRRYPAFAVGINGLGGYRLRLMPATRSLDLFKGPEDSGEVVGTMPFTWKSGVWTNLKIQVRLSSDTEWHIEGKAWQEGTDEPDAWQVSYTEKKEPLPGRPFVAASPYSGTPVQFDALVVTKTDN